MATLKCVRVAWTGTKGMPGVSTFYYDTLGDLQLTSIKSFFTAIKAAIPAAVTITVPSTGVTIDTATGQPNGTWSQPAAGGTVVGTGVGAFAAPVGAVVNWNTGVFVGGRQLRGKTFLVPLIGSTFEADGTITAGDLTAFRTAAANLIGANPGFNIWSRRSAAFAGVVSATVPDLPAVLRSRRD